MPFTRTGTQQENAAQEDDEFDLRRLDVSCCSPAGEQRVAEIMMVCPQRVKGYTDTIVGEVGGRWTTASEQRKGTW